MVDAPVSSDSERTTGPVRLHLWPMTDYEFRADTIQARGIWAFPSLARRASGCLWVERVQNHDEHKPFHDISRHVQMSLLASLHGCLQQPAFTSY
jgi:hypothetical protein